MSEGIFKCLKIERVAMKPSIALLGHSISTIQLEQLQQYKLLSKVIVWPDPDKVGIKGTIDVCNKLKDAGYKVYTLAEVPKKQADELPDDRVKDYLNNVVLFKWGVEQKLRNYASSM